MTWPAVGEPLPRAHDAYAPPDKWSLWILAQRGHGPHWQRVFRTIDAERIWAAISTEAVRAPIALVLDLGEFGRTCRVPIRLTLNDRTAAVITAWQYDYEGAPPRLVTAYPTT